MMVHVAVIKMVKKFDAMSMDEKVEKFDALNQFLTKYANETKVTESQYIWTPDKKYYQHTFYYTNKQGEHKTMTVTASNYHGTASVLLGWY